MRMRPASCDGESWQCSASFPGSTGRWAAVTACQQPGAQHIDEAWLVSATTCRLHSAQQLQASLLHAQ